MTRGPATGVAAVFREAGEPLALEELELPVLRGGEVLVRVSSCTLCGSDLHTYRGERAAPVPTILGHEVIGEVAAIGGGGSLMAVDGAPLEVGERITWSVAASCGECFFCGRGLPQKCDHLFKYGHEKLAGPHLWSGGLAEYCHLAAGTAVVRLPAALPERVACPANCATATVAAAVRVGSGTVRPESVLVHGAGMLGLAACAMVRSLGAHTVIVVDPDGDRLARARAFGATHLVEAEEGGAGPGEVVAEATGGRGVDLALEMSGSAVGAREGLDALRIGGSQVLVGSVLPTDPVTIDPEAMVRGMKTIHGVHNYTPRDLVAAVAFLERTHAEFPFESLVAGEFRLPEVEDAFREAIDSRAPRVLVTMR